MVTMPVWNVLFSILKKSAASCDKKSVCLRLDISKGKYVWNKQNGHNVFIVAFDTPIQMLPNTIQQKLWYCCMMWMNGKCHQFNALQFDVSVWQNTKTFIKNIVQQQQQHQKKKRYLTNETKSEWRHVTNILYAIKMIQREFLFVCCFHHVL